MSKTGNIFDEHIKTKTKIHDELFRKEKKALDELLNDKKYEIESMIERSSLGGAYHDLLNQKDHINSEYHSELNKGLHTVDVELYKLNKKLDHKMKMVDYKINQKKEELEFEIKKNLY